VSTVDTLPSLWPDSDPSVLAPVAEHDDLRSVARAILDKHADPEQVRAAVGSGAVPTEVWRLLTTELDLVAIAVPEVLGGAGYGLRELAVVLEETGSALIPDPVLSSAVLGAQALVLAEDPAGVDDIRASVLTGDLLATAWFGSADALELTTAGTATVTGALSRVLHGGNADWVAASATGPDGPVLVLVDLAGAERRDLDHVDTTRALCDVRLEAAPARVLVGPGGYDAARRRLETVRDVAVAAEHAGMVRHLLDLTVAYVTTRTQFGRPIGSFQAVKHRLADVLVARERCLSAVGYAAARYDADPDGAAPAGIVAAAVCTDAVLATAHEAIQLHGGIGFTWEHSAHLYLRRALGDEAQFGSARHHRRRLAAALEF
jgi:alkylation response protein AidB-like acyl-CoA dehydrogenase